MFLIESNTRYNFCILNILWYERDPQKSENKIIAKITRFTVDLRQWISTYVSSKICMHQIQQFCQVLLYVL